MNKLIVLIPMLLFTALADAKISVRVTHSYAADVFELLDNVSGWYPGFNWDQYGKHWTEKGLSRSEDASFFSEYATIRRKYFTDQEEKDPLKNKHGFFSTPASGGADRFSLAFYLSSTLEDSYAKLDAVVTPGELKTLKKFFKHFEKGLNEYHESLTRFYGVTGERPDSKSRRKETPSTRTT